MKTFKVYHIVCEGSSEVAYLNELNKHMKAIDGFGLHLKPYNLNGVVPFAKIKNKYHDACKAVKNKNIADKVFIWIDDDVFRKGKSKCDLQKVLNEFSGVKYNYENFEDFLVMHLSDEQVHNWHEICMREKHFDLPMPGEKVRELIQAIFPDYSKGSLPQEIQINDEALERLYKNHQDQTIKFESDFVDVIRQLLKNL